MKKLASIAVERGCGRLEWWFPALLRAKPVRQAGEFFVQYGMNRKEAGPCESW